ncbi:hypothetical protein E1A91_D05G392500v1 [Gossypium mustelinum]|uniref:Uncharacterized protein n=1 Tax=Gossypium mustelinum TaxID=34275 RepID=A0A5D2V6F7_GOSMU|nr:hypothetical protein E1A91_D05G392500v1 [Gossypium mustelinum]
MGAKNGLNVRAMGEVPNVDVSNHPSTIDTRVNNMGKLPSSFILRSLVNGGSHLSNFHSSSSSSSNTIAPHIKALSKKAMSVRGKGKRDDGFENMIGRYPVPSILEFTKLFAAIVRMKHYAIVVSMCSQMELLGVSHDVYSMSILINCFCQLDRIDFGLSILGKMLKLGVEPSAVTFSTLINGLCNQRYQPNLIVYNTVLKGFLRLMEGRGYEPNINGLLKEALDLFSEVKVKGIRPNIITYNCLIHGMCNSGQQEEATRLLNEMVDNNISLNIEGTISKAVEIIDTMRKKGIELDVEGMREIEPNASHSWYDGYGYSFQNLTDTPSPHIDSTKFIHSGKTFIHCKDLNLTKKNVLQIKIFCSKHRIISCTPDGPQHNHNRHQPPIKQRFRHQLIKV